MVFIINYGMPSQLLIKYTLERHLSISFKLWLISAMVLLKCYFWSIWIFILVKMIIWHWKHVVYQQSYLELLLEVLYLEIIWIWPDGNNECVVKKTQIRKTDMGCHPKSVFGPLCSFFLSSSQITYLHS